MKKKILLVLICFLLMISKVNAQKYDGETLKNVCDREGLICDIEAKEFNINLESIYIFKKGKNEESENLLEYLATLTKEYEVNIVIYDLTEENENQDLYQMVSEFYDFVPEKYPWTIIGSSTFVGFTEQDKEKIKEAITKLVEVEYFKSETLKEACETENLTCNFTEKAYDENLPNIYVFRGNGCPYCQRLLVFLSSIMDEYGKYANVVVYEVSQNHSNSVLYTEVGALFDFDAQTYPWMLIGNTPFSGYASEYDNGIKEAIKNLQKEEEDAVQKVIKTIDTSTLSANTEEYKDNIQKIIGEKIKLEQVNRSHTVVFVVMGIIIVLSLGIMGYYFMKKN